MAKKRTWRGDKIELQNLYFKLQDHNVNGSSMQEVRTRLAAVLAWEAGDAEAYQVISEIEAEINKQSK